MTLICETRDALALIDHKILLNEEDKIEYKKNLNETKAKIKDLDLEIKKNVIYSAGKLTKDLEHLKALEIPLQNGLVSLINYGMKLMDERALFQTKLDSLETKQQQTFKFDLSNNNNINNNTMTPKTNKQTKEVNKNKYSPETQKLLEELTTLQYLKLEKYFSNQFDEETAFSPKLPYNFLINELKSAKTEENVLNFQSVQLQDLTNSISKIMIRECYYSLYEIILNCLNKTENGLSKILITGTSGIGKSIFGYYLIHRFLNPIRSDEKKQLNIIYSSQYTNGFYFYDYEKGTSKFTKQLDELEIPQNTLIIVDGDEKYGAMLINRSTILISSPRSLHFNSFLKACNAIYYMPVWKLDEILDCKNKMFECLDIQSVKRLFSKYGGVPRYILQKFVHFPEEILIEELDSAIYLADYKSVCNNIGVQTDKDDGISSKFLHIYVEKFEKKRIVFASEYAKNKFVNKVKHVHKQDLALLLQQENKLSTVKGDIFEHFGHLTLKDGGEYDFRCIYCPDSDSYIKTNKFKMIKSPNSFNFDKIPSKSDFKNGYYTPTNRYYPAIDSFAYPNQLYNFTLMAKHTCIVCKEVKELIDLMAPNSDQYLDFFYFVSTKNYDTFEFDFNYSKNKPQNEKQTDFDNRLKELEKIEQYMRSKINVYLVKCDVTEILIGCNNPRNKK